MVYKFHYPTVCSRHRLFLKITADSTFFFFGSSAITEIMKDGFPCMYLFTRKRTEFASDKTQIIFFGITFLFVLANYSNSENNAALGNIKISWYNNLKC